MTTRITLFLFALAPVFCSAQTNNPKTAINSRLDSASYAIGLGVAEDLKSRGVSELNYAALSRALEDVFKNSDRAITLEQGQKAIYGFLSDANKTKYASVIEEGRKFLAENKTKAGVTTLPSGLQYQVIKSGTGIKPKATDSVTVHYKGTLLDGKQFDSSYDRKEPLTLQLNRVIPGWTEGVQQMSEGSKYKFFVPYEAAYGEHGAGQDIPPYSTLIFEIELIKVIPASAN